MLLVLGALGVFAVSGAFDGSTANAQGDHDHSDLEHHDRFTGPGTEAEWPPRPVGAPDLQPANPFAALSGGSAADSFVPPAQSDPEVVAALGADFSLLSTTEPQQGKYDYVGTVWTWFSRSNNQTVVVEEKQDGSLVVDILGITEMQPIISRPEAAVAAELGMAWLLENGFDEAEGLAGTSIRALDDGEFYDVRMAYVTFATDNFADPTHSTLVDLTNGVVVSGRSL